MYDRCESEEYDFDCCIRCTRFLDSDLEFDYDCYVECCYSG